MHTYIGLNHTLSYRTVSSWMSYPTYFQLATPTPPFPPLSPPLLKNKIPLRQRQRLRRLRPQHHPITLDRIRLRIDLHLRHQIIPLHVLLPDVPAILDRFDPFFEAVGGDLAGGDARAADEGDACAGHQGREHRPH